MWAKIITIKRNLNYSSVHWIYLIHEFHYLSWITEINELFHDILIWDAPVYMLYWTLMEQQILCENKSFKLFILFKIV